MLATILSKPLIACPLIEKVCRFCVEDAWYKVCAVTNEPIKNTCPLNLGSGSNAS